MTTATATDWTTEVDVAEPAAIRWRHWADQTIDAIAGDDERRRDLAINSLREFAAYVDCQFDAYGHYRQRQLADWNRKAEEAA